jgi:fermentation-respiration switch protein FrsA (DUF1100 family)
MALVLAVAAALIVALRLLGAADRLFYFPTRDVYRPVERWEPRPEDVWFSAPDGPRLHGWLFRGAGGGARGLVVHAHGNAGNLTGHAELSVFLCAAGFDVLAFDYRGYGRSEGAPTRAGTVADTGAALDWAAARAGGGRVLLFGQSLGAARGLVAAAERPESVAAIVAEAGFTTHRAIGSAALGSNLLFRPIASLIAAALLPAGPEPVDALARLEATPILFVHGSADRVIPHRMSEQLHAAKNGPKELLLLPGVGHLDALDRGAPGYRERIVVFLEKGY